MLQDVVSSNLFKQKNGILYYWDINRNKWLSVFRETFTFFHNHSNIDNDIWLKSVHKIPSNINGYLIKRKSVITSICARCKNFSDVIFKLKDENDINIYSFHLENKKHEIQDLLTIDLDIENCIKCFMEVNNKVDYPIIDVEISAVYS